MSPAPETGRTAKTLILRRVPGGHDRGGKRTNPMEAKAIADVVASHARNCPNLSLGIVTFSTAQRDLIGDILETRRRSDPELDACLADGGHEDVFVKNLENVQGDERDGILISIGYGPREANQPLDSVAFGPLSAEGGERRLNVLFLPAPASGAKSLPLLGPETSISNGPPAKVRACSSASSSSRKPVSPRKLPDRRRFRLSLRGRRRRSNRKLWL